MIYTPFRTKDLENVSVEIGDYHNHRQFADLTILDDGAAEGHAKPLPLGLAKDFHVQVEVDAVVDVTGVIVLEEDSWGAGLLSSSGTVRRAVTMVLLRLFWGFRVTRVDIVAAARADSGTTTTTTTTSATSVAAVAAAVAS